MRGIAAYGAAGLIVGVLAAGIAATVLQPAGARAVALSAAIAWMVQVVAFGGLVVGRSKPPLFMAVWLGGMVVRFAVLAALAFLVSGRGMAPAAPLLLGYVIVVFVLVLLEPVFLRRIRAG